MIVNGAIASNAVPMDLIDIGKIGYRASAIRMPSQKIHLTSAKWLHRLLIITAHPQSVIIILVDHHSIQVVLTQARLGPVKGQEAHHMQRERAKEKKIHRQKYHQKSPHPHPKPARSFSS